MLVVCILLIIGLLFVYSSSFLFALEKQGSTLFYVKHQIVGLCMGLIIAFYIQCIPVWLIRLSAPFAFIITTGLTALTLLPGRASIIHGSARWLSLGYFSFQPSELLKVAFVLYGAYLLARPTYAFERSSMFKMGLPLALTMIIVMTLLLLQPDFGLAVTLLITLFALIFVALGTVRHLLIAALVAIPGIIILIVARPYRVRRILTFLNPWDDPQGAGFQIIQSLIAIGSGKWFGVGISQSKQKFFYLPMQHTDFIFSIIAEETGFIGACSIIALYLLFAYFGFQIARALRDHFASYTVFGFIFLITVQACINLAVTTGLAPTKGTGLPLISYGKSSLISTLIMIALIVRFARNEIRQTYPFKNDIAL